MITFKIKNTKLIHILKSCVCIIDWLRKTKCLFLFYFPTLIMWRFAFHFVFLSSLSPQQLWEWNELKKQGIRAVFDCSWQKQTWPLTHLIKSTHTTFRLRLRMNVTLTFFTEICRCLEPLKIVWKDLLSPETLVKTHVEAEGVVLLLW